MINIDQFKTTPMGQAVTELSTRLRDEHMPPVSLNIIGGFALMMREIRNPNDTTDIDYVGQSLPAKFNRIADEIGMKHHLGKGWINNDVMLADISMEDFEFATGDLHFEHALDVGNISINVLEEPDLLRMKLISVDTSLTAIEMGGDFTRMKDLPDVKSLMDRQHITPDQLDKKFGEYMISDATPHIIQTYYNEGTEGVTREIDRRQAAYLQKLQKTRQTRSASVERSPFLQNLLDDLAKRAKESSDNYDF
jgi:hypothetical protein